MIMCLTLRRSAIISITSYSLAYANNVQTFKEKDGFLKQSGPGPKPLNTVTKVGMALSLLISRRALAQSGKLGFGLLLEGLME